MAPSTALLFVLYGIAAFLRTRLPMGRGAHRASVAMNSAGALVALLLLIMSFWGIHPAAEFVGFATAGTVGGASVGHMSPLTAIGFLLASLSFFGSLPSSSSRPWRARAAWWIACLLLGTAFLVFLAYLFGRPFFYGGFFIPPAATTGIAFASLGTALLALADRQESTAETIARVPYRFVLILALVAILSAGIVTVGGIIVRSDGRRYRAEVENRLAAVAELKANELVQWRSERLNDASLFADNPSFSALVQRVIDNPRDTKARAQLQAWLTKAQSHNLYDRISVLDTQSAERLAVPEEGVPVSSVIARCVPDVLRTGKVTIEDFYRDEHDQRAYLSVLVPIFDEQGRALGMLAFRIDPDTHLYPLLDRWPGPAQTAEMLLLRREGSDVLFLNNLKFQKHAALTLRIPLVSQKEAAAVKAVLGQEGILEAQNYREIPVLAALRAVPGSPWFLVARLDTAEVNAPLRDRFLVIVLLMGSMLAVAVAGTWGFWREQRVRHFRKLYEAERALAANRELLRLFVRRAPAAIAMFDTQMRYLAASDRWLSDYRLAGEDVIGRSHYEVFPEVPERWKRVHERVLAGATERCEEERFERADGSVDWVRWEMLPWRTAEGAVGGALLSTEVITERKRAEDALKLFRALVNQSNDALEVLDPKTGRFLDVNERSCQALGYSRDALLTMSIFDIDPMLDQASFARYRNLLRESGGGSWEGVHRRKDGSTFPVEVNMTLVQLDRGYVVAVARDITERKRAETRIRYLNRVYAVLSDVNQTIVRVREPQALFTEACRIAVEKGGFRMAWVGLLDAEANTVRLAAHAGVTDGYLDKLPIILGDGSGGPGPAASALHEGRHAVCNDIEHDPDAAAWRADALARGYRASSSFPLTVSGKTRGAFTLYASEPEFFDADELRLLDEMAADLSFAMEMGQLEERRRMLSTTIEQLPVSVIITDTEGRIEYVNPAFTQITGYEPAEALGKNPRLLKSGKQDRAFYENLWNTILAGKVWHEEVVNRRKDGSLYTEEGTITPVRSEGGQIIRFVSIRQDVTARRQMETEREQAQKTMADALRYTQKILDTSPLGIITYKVSGEAVAANPASAQLIGGSVEQVTAQNFRRLESWRRSGVLALAEEALASGAQRSREVQLTTTFGKEIWIDAHFVPFSYADEPHLLALFEDISERKQAERQLLRKTEELEAVFQSLPDLYFRMRRDGTVLDYLSDDRRKLYAPPEQFLGKKMQSVLPAEVGRQFEKALQEMEQSLTPVAFEYGLTADGQESLFEARLSRLHDDEVVALVRDITERKRAEEAVRQAEEKYRGIFEGAVVGIFQSDLSGRYLSVNPAMARMLGYDSTQELLTSVTDISRQVYVDPQSRQAFLLFIQQQGVVQNFECQVYRKNGSMIWVSVNARAVRKDGVLIGFEGTNVDITERKTLEEQLRGAQRMEAVGRLAGGVAHDFNNMLGVIIGYSQLLEEAHDWTETQNRQVKEIKKAADRAATITRQLLAFSRKQILQPRVLNLNAITADTSKLLRRLIGEDVELIINAGSDLGPVKADPGQIEQVIMNLAINARDAMPQGGKLVIETANTDLDGDYAAGHPPVQPGRYVMLAVSDTGCGMDAETEAHIFEPFFTTKELGKGTGLGLSIVYGFVKQSNGYIWVYSEPGQGTTFKIYLPRVEESPETIAPRRSEATIPGGTETILLVEDEPSLRIMARAFLEGKGYTILEAQSGQEAVEIARQHRGQIHLLLTDVIMPGMSGRELAETLAASRAGITLLYMSGYTDELVTQQGILNPGLQLLEKPFTRDSLLRRVRSVLDGES